MNEFNVSQFARHHGWDAVKVRRMFKALQIPPPEKRQPYHWEILRQVIERKHIVTMPIEVGARVIFSSGIHYIEKITNQDGTTYLWALGESYTINQCQYLYPNDRLSDWFDKCPKCHQNASDYVKRQLVGDKWHGGYAFCDACNVRWFPDFKSEKLSEKVN